MPSNKQNTTPTKVKAIEPVAPRAYTLQAVMQLLPGVTERQLKRWITKGHLKAIKPAGKSGPAFVTQAEFERFLNSGGAK